MDSRRHKVYAGSQALAALVFLQAASIPQLVNSAEMLRFATHALFGCQVFLSLLISFPLFCRSQQAPRQQGILEMSKPRLLTLTNGLTLLLLIVSVWAAWRACYRFWLMLAGAGLLVTLTLMLYRRNLRHWKTNYVQNRGAGE
jgi:hypothetical protein